MRYGYKCLISSRFSYIKKKSQCKICENFYKLIVMDINMPVKNGFEAS